MAAPELLHSAPDITRKTSEFRHLLPDASLIDTLRSLGHPYGLLLTQSNSSKESAESSIQNDPLLSSAQLTTLSKRDAKYYLRHPERKELKKDELENKFLSKFSLNSSSGGAPAIIKGFAVLATSAMSVHALDEIYQRLGIYNKVTNFARTLGVPINDFYNVDENVRVSTWATATSFLATTSIISAPSYVEGKYSKAWAKNIPPKYIPPLGLIIPSAISGNKQESSSLRSQELHIDQTSLTLGSTSLKLSTYRGQEPFTIKTPDGQPVTEIQPGDPLAALHVSHQAARFRRLSPLEKAHAMVNDVTQLLTAIDHTDPSTLSTDQQTTLVQAKYATIIGISHLVRLFRRQTGLPTWKLDILPPLLQRFHALDSQAVSTQFGGKRKVRPNDIEMLVLTPSQRRQLLTNLQT